MFNILTEISKDKRTDMTQMDKNLMIGAEKTNVRNTRQNYLYTISSKYRVLGQSIV